MSYTPEINANVIEVYLGLCATGRAQAGNTTLDNVAFGTLYAPRPSITFTPDDVGMPIAIVGGGPVDPDMPVTFYVQGATFVTTVAAYVSPSQVTLTNAPVTAIWNTGFATIILYRPVPIASDVANVSTAFQFSSSIAPGTNDTLQFSVLNSNATQANPYVERFGPILLGQPVYMRASDDSFPPFGGYIDTLETMSQPGVIGAIYEWAVSCASWTGLARRRCVPPAIPQSFTSIDGDIVFRKLVLDYLSNDGVSVTTATAPPITLAAAVGADIGQLLDQVVSLISDPDTAWYWTTDPWRNFILAKRTSIPAPWDITDGSDLFTGSAPYQQSIVQTHNQMANQVYAIGSAVLMNTLNAQFVGNGTATTFDTPADIGAVPIITLNGGPQAVGILGVETGKDWYWSQGSTTITQATGATVLTASDILLVSYTPQIPAVASAPNAASLQQLQAIEGTSANYEHSFSVSQPILPNDLLAMAAAYEIEYGEPAATCNLYTLRPGLQTGQLQSISLPDAGIPAGDYLIATTQMSTLNGVIVWQYTAFGGANIGDAITAFTQFINRGQATLNIITPTVPIQAGGGPPGDFLLAYDPSAAVNSGTMPMPVVVGDVLIGIFTGWGPEFGGPVLNVTDSLGNTWTQITQVNQDTFFYAAGVAVSWTTVATSGVCTINVSSNSIAFIAIKAPAGITGVDAFASLNTGFNPTVTTAQANDFVITGGISVVMAPTATAPEAVVTYGLAHGSYINGIALAYANPAASGSFTSSLYMDANAPGYLSAIVSVAFLTAQVQPPQQTTDVLVNPTGTVINAGALTLNAPILGDGGVTIKAGPAGLLVPPGGTAGQALEKASGTDYDTHWVTPAAPIPTVHDEPLTDGDSNFIFAAGDCVVVIGIPN